MINYNFMNYNKRTYVSGSIVKGERRDTSDCAGLFDDEAAWYV